MGLLEARKKAAAAREQAAQPKGAFAKAKAKTDNKVEKPKGAFAAAKAKKAKNGPAFAALSQRKAESRKRDIVRDSIRYGNVRIHDSDDKLWVEIDVRTPDETFHLHDQFGSWLCVIPGKEGYFREPAALGIGSQIDVCMNLNTRRDVELKALGILTPAEKRAKREAEEAEARKKAAKKEAAKKKRAKTMAAKRKEREAKQRA